MQSLQLSYQDLQLHSTLLDHNFDTKQSVAGHKRPHSRYMKSGSKYFPHYSSSLRDEKPEADRLSQRDQLCLFIPFLNWDTYGSMKRRIELIAARLAETQPEVRNFGHPKSSSIEEKLIRHYLVEPSNLPLHQRRTLDQYGYPNLRSTHARDHDQILYKRTSETIKARRGPAADPEPRKALGRGPHIKVKAAKSSASAADDKRAEDEAKVIMVDQLWLWITDAGRMLMSLHAQYHKLDTD